MTGRPENRVVTTHLARALKPQGSQGSPGMLQGGIWEPSGGIQIPWVQPNTVLKVKRAPMQANTAPVQPNAGPVQPNATPVQPNAGPVQPNATPVQPNAIKYCPMEGIKYIKNQKLIYKAK